MNWVYDLPTWAFSLLLCGLMVGIAVGGHVLVRRFSEREPLRKHNDVAGFVASLVGVIYAVLLSFVVVLVWQEYDTATAVAQKEASSVADLYHLSYGFPDPQAGILRRQLATYIRDILEREWPAMQHGGTSHVTEVDGHGILRTIMTFKPGTAMDIQMRGMAIADVQTFFDARRDRLSENQTSLPRILWVTLILGAIVTIGLTYLFGVESARSQLTMTGALTLLIAMLFVLIIELDFPFRGETKVQPVMWSDIRAEMGTGLPENAYRP